MNVIEDAIINPPSLSQDMDGFEAVRTFIIENVGGNRHNRLFIASSAPKVPQFADPHPSIPNLRCIQRQLSLVNGSTADVVAVCTYRIPKPVEKPPSPAPGPGAGTGVIRVGATVQQTMTQKDRFGAPIFTEYTFPATDEEFGGKTKTQGVDVDISVPNLVLSETRVENGTPANIARAYVGTVNQVPIWGGAARTYLCTRIDGQSSDGGITYEVGYEFQYNAATWDATVVFRDPRTQDPVVDPVPGTSVKTFIVYQEASFSSLGLSL